MAKPAHLMQWRSACNHSLLHISQGPGPLYPSSPCHTLPPFLILCPPPPHPPSIQSKKLPRTVTISALKLLCEKLFKVWGGATGRVGGVPPSCAHHSSLLPLQVKAAHMTLFLRRGGDPVPEEIGAEDDKTLGICALHASYSVSHSTECSLQLAPATFARPHRRYIPLVPQVRTACASLSKPPKKKTRLAFSLFLSCAIQRHGMHPTEFPRSIPGICWMAATGPVALEGA